RDCSQSERPARKFVIVGKAREREVDVPRIHAGVRAMLKTLIPCLSAVAMVAVTVSWIATAPAQPGFEEKKAPKKGPAKKGDEAQLFPERLDRLRRQLEAPHPANPERQTLLMQSGALAKKADQIWRAQQPYIADRTLAAAEALFHAADHLDHLASSQRDP